MQAAKATFECARSAFAAGDLAGSERLCREIIAAHSRDALPWALLSEIASLRNERDAALACAREALRCDPGSLLAHVMNAKSLLQCGRYAEAVAAAEAGARVSAAPADALDGLGAVLGMLGRHRRALAVLSQAVASRPGVPQSLFNLAATERMLGALEAAEAHCAEAIAVDRHFYRAYYLRSDLRTQTRDRNHIVEMTTLIRDGTRTWQGEVMLRYALGKEYEDLGEHGLSFAEVKAGADLQRRHMTYDVSRDIAMIDRVIGTQTRSWLASAPAGYAAAEPVFVMGLPRSGTTVVERIIGSHSAMTSVGEVGAFPVHVARALADARRGGDEPAAPQKLDVAELGKSYIASVAALASVTDCRFLDKTLQNYLYCGWIHAALPKAKIIMVRRNPLDLCYALYKAHFQGTFQFSYDLTEVAEYYLAFCRLLRHWRAVLPQNVLLEISYDDIVRDQAAESRRIIEFLNLPWEDGVLRFHESRAPSATASAVQVRRPLYASSVGRWRYHAQALMPLRMRLERELPVGEL